MRDLTQEGIERKKEAFRAYCAEQYETARWTGLHGSAHDAVDWIPLLMGRDRIRNVLQSEEFKSYYAQSIRYSGSSR